MTTTAATTSASPSTSNDSPIQDNNGATEPTIEHHQQQQQQSSKQPQQANTEQKRPMNAFLLFCKRQRSLVREKYPNLENRGITKILGDWWSKLDKEQKSKYTDLARQHKEAFMKANPDFKWCKTPMSNNNNSSNTNSNSNSNSNSNDCYATNNRHKESPIPPTHIDVGQSNSRDSLVNRQQPTQHEAPKPPKKRFLERNDSVYSKNNSSNNESTSHANDGVVPFISFDQKTIERVIDDAFSEKSNNSPAGINMCKNSNRNSTNLTSTISGVNPTPFSTSTTISSYSDTEKPVDFSMNRTINATRQQIINHYVERMMLGTADKASSSSSKMNGTDSAQNQSGPPVKRDNPDDT